MVRRSTANPRETKNPRPNPSMKCGCPPCLRKFPGDRPPAVEHIGTWEARYTDPHGRGRSKNWPTETEAVHFLEQTHTEIRQRTWIDPARGEITLCHWHSLWWPTQTGQETTQDRDLRSWRNHIEPHFGSLRLYEFEWREIQLWVNGLVDENGGPLAPSSVVKTFQILDRMLEAAKRDRRIPFNPAEGVKMPKIKKKHPEDRKPPTYGQLWRIRACLPKWLHNVQVLAQETGLRFGEIAGLRWCWVDLEGRRLQVREVLTEVGGRIKRKRYPKSSAGLRTVPLTGLAVAVLREVLAASPNASRVESEPGDGLREDELVFHGRNGKCRRTGRPYRAPLRRSTVRRRWIDAIEAAGVARKTVRKVTVQKPDPTTGRMRKVQEERVDWWPDFHHQRHTLTSRLHARGVPEVVTQEILGHERAGQVTWLYTHAAADCAGQVLAAMDDWRRGGRRRPERALRLVS
ncbi:tyrosine-type recombinase/integrase [Streptomyces sp. NPDC055078]